MVGREILSHAQQEKGNSAQVYRQSLFNKSKVRTYSKYHVKKEHEGEEVSVHVFVFHTFYLTCVRRIPDTY